MTATELKAEIESLVGAVCFDYKGKNCGVDPFNEHKFDMWFGDDNRWVTSIDEVMSYPLFDGKSLADIAEKIEFW